MYLCGMEQMDWKAKLKLQIDQRTVESSNELDLDIFSYHMTYNKVYNQYVTLLKGLDFTPHNSQDIPFLPISFFKTHQVTSLPDKEFERIFLSSGTTNQDRSKHYVYDEHFYLNHAQTLFEEHYGNIEDYTIAALLPGYYENEHSSLLAMVNHLIRKSDNSSSSFYLDNESQLIDLLDDRGNSKKVLLFAVTHALLDLVEKYDVDFSNVLVIETGGMKGRRIEWTKEQLHTFLIKKTKASAIHTEYGMTELMSQAYGIGNVIKTNKYFQIEIVEITDPLTARANRKVGILKVKDYGNLDTCCFIETEDLAIQYDDGTFALQGRLDHAEIRGCNLLVQDML